MPDLETSIWQRYRDQGVLVVAIHRGEDPIQLANFIEQAGITFPVLQDEGSFRELSFPPGVGYPYPRDVVIGADLTIRSIRNSFNITELDEQVRALIAERDAAGP